ncbi:MAG: hypothetical protein R3356_09670, partial [Eudoraea sp.]|nr:hypothetical protein [Eudoraea sp.]
GSVDKTSVTIQFQCIPIALLRLNSFGHNMKNKKKVVNLKEYRTKLVEQKGFAYWQTRFKEKTLGYPRVFYLL